LGSQLFDDEGVEQHLDRHADRSRGMDGGTVHLLVLAALAAVAL
jgi:hypothetical protein